MKNVHIIVRNDNPITVVFATCAVSQVQIHKFSCKTVHAPSDEIQGHCLKNDRSRSHFVHFCRKYNFNVRELLWANRTWHSLQHKFLLKQSCMGMDIVSKLCSKLMKSLNVLPKISYSSRKDAVTSHNPSFVDESMKLESNYFLRATTSRNIYLEFLFHDECCNRNLDFIAHSDEANNKKCSDVFFTPRSNVSFPKTLSMKELVEAKSRSYYTLGRAPLTIATHSSKMFEKEAVVLLAYLDGCDQTGKLILRDETGTLPVIIENKDGVDPDFWFQLLADVNVDGICDTNESIHKYFGGKSKKILKLKAFWIIDEYYCRREDILRIGSPGQRGHRRHVQVCKDDFDLGFSCSYNPVEIRSNVPKNLRVKPATDHSSQGCYSLCVCITNVSHVSLREYQRKSPYFGVRIHGYVVEPLVNNVTSQPILSYPEECVDIIVNAGYAVYQKLSGDISNEHLHFFKQGFPSSIGLLSLLYPKHTIFRISFNNTDQICIEQNTGNLRNKVYVLNLDFESTIYPVMSPKLSRLSPQSSIPQFVTSGDTAILSVSECLALGALKPHQNRSNVNVRGILYRKVIEDARSRRSKEHPKLQTNIGDMLGVGNYEKKLKITLQDEKTLDQIDFFFDCGYVVLPEGMHAGCVMRLDHLFLRVKSTNVYLAEQSFNMKKRTRSTKISILRHTLLSEQCNEKTPGIFDFKRTTRMLCTRRGCLSKVSTLSMFIIMKYYVFIRELTYVIVRQTRRRASEDKASLSWECSVLADDGTGEAKIFFDGESVLELLNICRRTQSMVEDAAIRNQTCFEYSKARDITENRTNSQRCDAQTVQEKDFDSNSVAKLSSAFRTLVRTSFTSREAVVFCKAKQMSTQSTTTVNISVNDQQIESKRILPPRLRCHYVCCTSKRFTNTSFKKTVPYRLEAYNNIQNVEKNSDAMG